MIQTFPQYRKLSNGKSYYKLENKDNLVELQRLGNKWLRHNLVVKILPDRNLMFDLLSDKSEQYLTITASEFEEIEKRAEAQKE